MTKPRTIAITDFLTPAQITRAWKLYEDAPPYTFSRRCAKDIIEPNIDEINKKLGQDNHPLYLAYAVQVVFNAAKGWDSKHTLKGE
jgi:hypothetical protein